MATAVRPVKTFVVRLWQEPGALEGDAAWRGLVRALETGANPGRSEIAFHGLDNLPQAVRPLLAEEAPATAQTELP
jgi:hypothetical protein